MNLKVRIGSGTGYVSRKKPEFTRFPRSSGSREMAFGRRPLSILEFLSTKPVFGKQFAIFKTFRVQKRHLLTQHTHERGAQRYK